jgi:predicted short-subunit dehydrogenase-like oxidoreductase (DUF2520 family)
VKLRVTIVGAGALARALVEALPPARVVLTIVARRPAAARRLAKLSRGASAQDRGEALRSAQVVLLAVDDRAIPAVARELAPLRRSWRGVVVLHAAGGVPVSALAPLARLGASTGVLHPILPLHRSGQARLAGAPARIAGSPKAKAAAKRLAAWTGLSPLPRRRAERATDVDLHHAAAALCTGDVLALLTLAEDALYASGVPRPAARRAALSAAAATLDRIGRSGPGATLSGPVVRGDLPRLLRHLGALAAVHPQAALAHRALTLRLADLAVEAGVITRPAAAKLARGLGRSSTV